MEYLKKWKNTILFTINFLQNVFMNSIHWRIDIQRRPDLRHFNNNKVSYFQTHGIFDKILSVDEKIFSK